MRGVPTPIGGLHFTWGPQCRTIRHVWTAALNEWAADEVPASSWRPKYGSRSMSPVRTARMAFAATASLCLLFAATARAQDRTWPRELDTEKGALTIYQPQPEKFENNMLQGRAAVSLLSKGEKAPVFGVFWFSGRV